MHKKRRRKHWYTKKHGNVYASLAYSWDLYNGDVRKAILIFLILFE